MPNNEVVKSKRDLAMERIKAKYPDKSFDDDEAFFGQINDDYDDYDKPTILVKSFFQMADCSKKPCGRPSCSTKPSGKH